MPVTGNSPEMLLIPTCDALLGEGMSIRRALPSAQCRMIGAWCFLDHFGPVDATRGDGLRVGPHPHNSLQTFTWPLAGEILHRDSLGYEQIIRPGEVNLMTAGRGISHSEESPSIRSPRLHGAQLWIALPEAVRHCEPGFEHYPALPTIDRDGFRITVLVGEALGELAPTRVFSPLLALDIACDGDSATSLAVPAEYELGALVLDGMGSVEDQPLAVGQLLSLDHGRDRLHVRSAEAGVTFRLLVIGGAPFGEDILMWWNFVGRSRQELARAVAEWNVGAARFGEVRGYVGDRLPAPSPSWVVGRG